MFNQYCQSCFCFLSSLRRPRKAPKVVSWNETHLKPYKTIQALPYYFLAMREIGQLDRKCSTHQTKWDTFPGTDHTAKHNRVQCRAQKTLQFHRPNHRLHLRHIVSFTNTSRLLHFSGPFPHVLFMYWPPRETHCITLGQN